MDRESGSLVTMAVYLCEHARKTHPPAAKRNSLQRNGGGGERGSGGRGWRGEGRYDLCKPVYCRLNTC